MDGGTDRLIDGRLLAELVWSVDEPVATLIVVWQMTRFRMIINPLDSGRWRGYDLTMGGLGADQNAPSPVGALVGIDHAALQIVRLASLMALTQGRSEMLVGIVDGPVDWQQTALSNAQVPDASRDQVVCDRTDGSACAHGTFVAGILAAARGSQAPAICPGCTFLACSVFDDDRRDVDAQLSATPGEVAQAIVDCVTAGVRVLNLSAATGQPTIRLDGSLQEALDLAARRGVIVIAAAGNQGTLGTSTITRHPWVVPVVACDAAGRPLSGSNLATSLGRRGLAAPGTVTSLKINGEAVTLAGTSFAAPIVTGTIALLWSLYPMTPAATLRDVVIHAGGIRRRSVVPPVLDAETALSDLTARMGGVITQVGGFGHG